MTFVVIDKCIKCKYTDCVEVCPVDCFHEGPNMLVIDPEECIDCTLCEPECPVEAILSEDDLTDDQQEWLALNTELSLEWPVITEMKAAPEDAEEWENVEREGRVPGALIPAAATRGPLREYPGRAAVGCPATTAGLNPHPRTPEWQRRPARRFEELRRGRRLPDPRSRIPAFRRPVPIV